MFESNAIFSSQWIEIVFEGRNKDYGAYLLRKKDAGNTVIAVILAIVLFVTFISAPVIIKLLKGPDADKEIKIVEVTTLAAPPPIDPNTPPPPPVEPPPPLKTTVKFVAPKIVKDEEVQDEPPPTQEELKDVEVGAKSEQGDSSGVDLSLVENNKVIDDESTTNNIFTVVEQMPEFEGGEKELFAFLQKNIKYPAMAKDAGITGTVYLTFVIDREGKTSDIKILRGIGGGCDQEAIRVVKAMPPWKPGKQNGKPVLVQFNLPLKFTLK